MSRPVLTNETGETLGDAWQLMFVSGLRHLVVLDDDGVPFGVLSDRAVLAGSPSTIDHWGNLLVRDVLARVPRGSIRPDSTAQQAVHEMSHRAVEALPVTEEGGKLVGILTESDVVRWVGTAA
ncbi:MAG: CBS domain-containing protein [Actinobacteria bacterium]|nr:CBS domain-containing protein [Actinomycetota bacterium]